MGLTDNIYEPGDFSPYTYDHGSMDVEHMALAVKADLLSDSFNYVCVEKTLSRPAAVGSGKLAICIRKGTIDFHLMKLITGGVWRHKPGQTHILQYNYLPETSRLWYAEGVYDGTVISSSEIYSGDIWYIIASPYHGTTSTELSGNHYHSGTIHYYEYATICTTCRVVLSTEWRSQVCSGPPCMPPGEIMSIEPETE